MAKLWYAYRRAKDSDKDVKKMEKYARAIQEVQKDMGIKTTSFPHLGIYGDVFILNDRNGKRIAFEDHSALKKKQEEYEKWQNENSKAIQQHVQIPNKEAGEEIEVFADDKSLGDKQEPEADEIVPDMLEPDEEEGEEEIIIIDDIPFRSDKEAGEEIVTIADDVYPSEKQEPEEREIVPDMLEPDEEEGEEEIIIIDDIPF